MSTSFGIARRFLPICAGLVVALTLSACDKKSEPASSGANAPATATDNSSATSTVTPHTGASADAASGKGPAEAGTAIGGMVGNQEKGGAKDGGAPAKTGGDGSSQSK